MSEKDEYQQGHLKYSIWNTNTKGVHLDQDLTIRAMKFKQSLNKLGKASKADDEI
jgi:hypothetical protein